jgi:hypothetical protein
MIRRKRNTWIVEKNGQVFKFGTEAEANLAFNGITVSEPVMHKVEELEKDFDLFEEEFLDAEEEQDS